MEEMKKTFKALHKGIDSAFCFIATNVITICLLWIFFAFLICIVYRYILHYSLAALEESYTIALLYMALVGAAYSFRMKSNTTFDLLYDVMGDLSKAIMNLLAKVVMIATFCVLLNPVWNDILFYDMRKTSLLKISYMILYMPFMLVLFSGIYYNAYFIITEDIPAIYKSVHKKSAPAPKTEEGGK